MVLVTDGSRSKRARVLSYFRPAVSLSDDFFAGLEPMKLLDPMGECE